jgi:hypothetical protein
MNKSVRLGRRDCERWCTPHPATLNTDRRDRQRAQVSLASDDDSVQLFSHSGLIFFMFDGASSRKDIFVGNQQTHLRVIANQDGAAILDTKAGRISTLNTSGAYIWQALERGEDIEYIAQGLSRDTGEQMDVVKRDVADFIDALRRQDLLPG